MPPRSTSYGVYKVVKGDTLAAIAKRFGLTVNQIAVASGVTNPDKIKVGQTLMIPGGLPDPGDELTEVEVTAQARPIVMSSPKTPPARSAEVMLMDTANYLADWLKPPKLYVTLGIAAAAGYILLADKPARRKRR
jgi:LysM repeat protein